LARANARKPVKAVTLSFIWPGLGEAYAGRRLPYVLAWALPPLAIVGGLLIYAAIDPATFAVNLLSPAFAAVVVGLIAIHGIWRTGSIINARRLTKAPGRRLDGVLALVVVLSLLVVALHVAAGYYVSSFSTAGNKIFVGVRPAGNDPLGGLLGGPVTSPTPGPSGQLAGDCNHDGVVDGSDILAGDTNGDCVVDANDDPETDPGTGGKGTPPPNQGPPDLTPPPLDPNDQIGVLPDAGPINVLFVGLDSGFDRTHALTDSLIVASYDPDHDKLTMFSIPRDTGRMPLYKGGIYPNRINSFMGYARGNAALFPEGPTDALLHELSYVFGTNIPFYAATNLEGLPRALDAVGGIDFNLTYQIADPHLNLYMQPGKYHLTGATILPFVRSRHGPNNSDWQRQRRQQDVLKALANKAEQPNVLLHLPSVIDALSAAVRTNVPRDQTNTLLKILRRANDASTTHVILTPPTYTRRIPSDEVNGRWMVQLVMPSIRDLSKEIFGTYSRYP
jgi:LCP family protein required for cell wall assembly